MSWNGVERRNKKRYGVKNSTVKYRKGAFVLFAPLRVFVLQTFPRIVPSPQFPC